VSAEPELDLVNQSSGAYIFRPSQKFPNATLVPETPVLTVSRGALVQEVRIEVNSWISQIVRLPATAAHLEVLALLLSFPLPLASSPISSSLSKQYH